MSTLEFLNAFYGFTAEQSDLDLSQLRDNGAIEHIELATWNNGAVYSRDPGSIYVTEFTGI